MADRGLRQSVPNVPMPKADVSGGPLQSQVEPLKPPPSGTWPPGWRRELHRAMPTAQDGALHCAECSKAWPCDVVNQPSGPKERGVWVVYHHDQGPHVESVHATELEALRVINDATGKRVAFVPFGSEVREVLR